MTEYDDDDGGLWDAGGDEEMAEGARILRNLFAARLFAPMLIRTCVFDEFQMIID